MLRKLVIAGLALPAMLGVAHAAPVPITVITTPGTTYNTAALTGFSTFSADMVGSLVTVTYAGGATAQAVWTATGASVANTWSLTMGGDSFSSPWTLTSTNRSAAITGLSFNGVPGNTAFDILSGSTGSPGSADGLPASDGTGPAGLSAIATYSNRLQVGGVFYNDLYTNLSFQFSGAGLLAGSTFTFTADTDNASAQAGGITPGVPEPATWAMMIMGFGAMGGLMRRKGASVRVRYA